MPPAGARRARPDESASPADSTVKPPSGCASTIPSVSAGRSASRQIPRPSQSTRSRSRPEAAAPTKTRAEAAAETRGENGLELVLGLERRELDLEALQRRGVLDLDGRLPRPVAVGLGMDLEGARGNRREPDLSRVVGGPPARFSEGEKRDARLGQRDPSSSRPEARAGLRSEAARSSGRARRAWARRRERTRHPPGSAGRRRPARASRPAARGTRGTRRRVRRARRSAPPGFSRHSNTTSAGTPRFPRRTRPDKRVASTASFSFEVRARAQIDRAPHPPTGDLELEDVPARLQPRRTPPASPATTRRPGNAPDRSRPECRPVAGRAAVEREPPRLVLESRVQGDLDRQRRPAQEVRDREECARAGGDVDRGRLRAPVLRTNVGAPASGGKAVEDRVVGRDAGERSRRSALSAPASPPRRASRRAARHRRRRGSPGGPRDRRCPRRAARSSAWPEAPRGSTSTGRDTAVGAWPSFEARATTAPAGMGTSASRGSNARSRRPEARLTSSSERVPGGAATATRPPGARKSRTVRVRPTPRPHHDPFVGRESEPLGEGAHREFAGFGAQRLARRSAGERRRRRSGTRQTRQGTSRRGSPASQRKESVSPSAAASAAASRRGKLTREA